MRKFNEDDVARAILSVLAMASEPQFRYKIHQEIYKRPHSIIIAADTFLEALGALEKDGCVRAPARLATEKSVAVNQGQYYEITDLGREKRLELAEKSSGNGRGGDGNNPRRPIYVR